MRPRLLLATGDEALDAALCARAVVVACERLPEAALAAARREYPDAAVVAARLSGEDTDALVEALLDEGVRVLWLSGRAREARDRGVAAGRVAFASCEVVAAPFDADDLMRRIDAAWDAGPVPSGNPGGWPTGRMVERGAERVADRVADATGPYDPDPSLGAGARAGQGPDRDPTVAGEDGGTPAPVPGLTVFVGALPGCGTSTSAVAWARGVAAGGAGPLLLIDAHAERAHLAHMLLGRHLDPLVPADRSRSWRHAREAGALRRCLVEVSPGLHLLPLAFDPDPVEAYPGAGGQPDAPDLAVRWTASTVTADLVCGREFTSEDAVAVLRALGASGRVVRVRACAEELSDADRGLWTEQLGVWVAGGTGAGGGPVRGGAGWPWAAGARLVAELRRALRVCGHDAPSWVVDLGAPPPLLAGVADPRVSWAACNGRVVVVTRPDGIGSLAAERLLTTLRAEAGRAGVRLRAEVVEGGPLAGGRGAPLVGAARRG